jgi:predicted PurR-regulated permease PerM
MTDDPTRSHPNVPSSPPPPPPNAGKPTLPRSAATPSDAGPRTWLRRWRRVTQPTPPDLDTGPSMNPDRTSLLLRNPFHIGFFIAAGAMAAYGVVQVLIQVQSIILIVLLALVLALGLNPAVEWFHRRGIRRGLCVLIVALLVVGIVTLVFWAVLPTVISQVQQLFQNAPAWLDGLRRNPMIDEIDQQFDIINQITTFLKSGNLISWAFGSLAGTVNFMASLVFQTIITIVLTLYFLASLPSLREVLYNLSPASRRARVKYLISEILKRVGGYVSGLFMVAIMAACYTFVVVSLVTMFTAPGLAGYSLALAALLMILYFIPIVGSTIAILTIGIVGFFFSPLTGILLLALLFAYQQFDAYFISPRVFSKSVQVPGIIVILAAMSGGYVAGMIGAILAVPIMAALMLLYREVLIPHLNRR